MSTILLTMYDGADPASLPGGRGGAGSTSATVGARARSSRGVVRVSEAPSYGQSVMSYDPGSSGAQAYLEAAREVADRAAQLGQTGDGWIALRRLRSWPADGPLRAAVDRWGWRP